jgi:PAS domain S-box-containing protein
MATTINWLHHPKVPARKLKDNNLHHRTGELSEHELRFLAACESSNDAFFILESVRDQYGFICDFRFTYVNENGAKLLESTPEQLQGMLLCETYPVNRTDGFFDRYKRVVETDQRLDEEFPIDAKGINASWLHYRVCKLNDGVAITTQDISSRKRDEERMLETMESLRRSEAHLLEVQQLARLGNWEVDLVSGVYKWSDEVYCILRRDPGAGPMSLDEVAQRIHPEDVSRVTEIFKRLMNQGDAHELHCRLLFENGDVRYIHSRARCHLDKSGHAFRLSGTMMDVSEKFLLHNALHASDKRFEAFMQNAPASAFIKDDDGNLLYMNEKCRKLSGLSTDECQGKMDADLWSPELASAFQTDDQLVLRNDAPMQFVEVLSYAGGELRTMLTNKFPIRIDGQPTLIGGFSIDITEQQESEKNMLKALAEKDVLLKEVHHRVKNNLQVICSLLAMQAANANDQKIESALSDSHNRVHAMAMIHEMLYGSDTLGDIDFEGYARELLGELLTSYQVSAGRIRPVFNVFPMKLSIDRAVPCGLILNELISNALKHAFPGDRDGEIRVSFAPHGEERYQIVVEDTGVGLPDGFSVETSDSLGLRIVEILVKQLNGTCSFSSSNGMKFLMQFPIELSAVSPGPYHRSYPLPPST